MVFLIRPWFATFVMLAETSESRHWGSIAGISRQSRFSETGRNSSAFFLCAASVHHNEQDVRKSRSTIDWLLSLLDWFGTRLYRTIAGMPKTVGGSEQRELKKYLQWNKSVCWPLFMTYEQILDKAALCSLCNGLEDNCYETINVLASRFPRDNFFVMKFHPIKSFFRQQPWMKLRLSAA